MEHESNGEKRQMRALIALLVLAAATVIASGCTPCEVFFGSESHLYLEGCF